MSSSRDPQTANADEKKSMEKVGLYYPVVLIYQQMTVLYRLQWLIICGNPLYFCVSTENGECFMTVINMGRV